MCALSQQANDVKFTTGIMITQYFDCEEYNGRLELNRLAALIVNWRILLVKKIFDLWLNFILLKLLSAKFYKLRVKGAEFQEIRIPGHM